ncbi:glycosyltransferase [Corallincola holothuriorum]|uniref:Glycosyltransferase n=1 Tax=Corallincola holothuriorum TaxID=2282215 RepID=A0A368N6L3_9GAMM|nr:glycosyltransferase [Corallincola holothuriorum]
MESKSPKVSVIIPTYNRAEFILEAIHSVFAQDYTNIEIIIIDDGSTDETAELLAPYIEQGKVLYRYQENQRQCVARNNAMSIATGELWCFLDSDNRWLPGKLKTQVTYMQTNPSVDIVYGDNQLIDDEGKITSQKNMRRHSGRIYPEMLRDNCVSMNTVMARAECFKRHGTFDPSFKVADDYELWLRLSAHYEFIYLPIFFAQYRVMEDQISSDKERRFLSNERALMKFQQQNPNLLRQSEWDAVFAFFYTRWARVRYVKSDVSGMKQMLNKALHYQWHNKYVWRAILKWLLRR